MPLDKVFLHRAVLCVACLFSIIYGGQVAAEPVGVVKWLMNKPLTLWDMGMIRIEKAAELAAAKMNTEYRDAAVHYVWDQNEIIISFGGRLAKGHATHEKCNEIRRSIIEDMTKLKIRLFKSLPLHRRDSWIQGHLTSVVNDWFSHKYFEAGGRDKKLGKKMANKIYIEVMILSALGPKGVVESAIRCNENIITLDAPSQPTSPDLAGLYFISPPKRAEVLSSEPTPQKTSK